MKSFGSVVVALGLALAGCRGPSPGEQGGLGDLRTFMAAERSYAGANGGYFDEPSCLAAPARCIPGYAETGPVFIDTAWSGLTPRLGYAFRFHAGPAAPPAEREKAKASTSSLTAFALVAVPAPGSRQRRAFCGDSSDRICARSDGTMPEVRDATCPADCETLH
jgi:hypothetical protein